MVQTGRGLPQQRHHFRAGRGIAARDQYAVAALGEAQGDGPADASGAAGDQ